MTVPQWRKSTRCGANKGCVELLGTARFVVVRDSKIGDGSPLLTFDRAKFAEFVAFVKVAY